MVISIKKQSWQRVFFLALPVFVFLTLASLAATSEPAPESPPPGPTQVHDVKVWIGQHGKEFVKNKDFCKACHAPDLSGGFTGFKCDLCHLKPEHPPEWKGTHGPQYLAAKQQCLLCHGKDPFSGTKEPYAMNCTRCHSVNKDIAGWQSESQTSQVYLNFSEVTQLRKDRFAKQELASSVYSGFHLSERPHQIIASSHFRFTREWLDEKNNNIDLYEAYVEIDNLFKKKVDLKVGRWGFGSYIDYYLMDGLDLKIKPSRFFNISVYSGIPRYVELDDLDGNIGLVSGLSFKLNEINYTKAKIDVTYQRNDFLNNDWNNTDKLYVSGSVSKGISFFKLYGLGEYDATDTLLTTATVGTEIYPFVKKVSFLLEGGYFNESRNDNLESIFTIFSEGALWQSRGGVAINAFKNFAISDYFSFQRYEVLPGLYKSGYNNSTGLNYFFDKIKLEAGLNYSFTKSYGGTLHVVSLSLYEEWNRHLFTNAFFDYFTYTKITNNDDYGFDAMLETGLKINRQAWFSITAEYLNNNVMEQDLRGMLKFQYTFDMKFNPQATAKGSQ